MEKKKEENVCAMCDCYERNCNNLCGILYHADAKIFKQINFSSKSQWKSDLDAIRRQRRRCPLAQSSPSSAVAAVLLKAGFGGSQRDQPILPLLLGRGADVDVLQLN